MASKLPAIRKLLTNLRDSSKSQCIKSQCAALTNFCSNAQELEKTLALSEEECSEICSIVMDMTASLHQNAREEATKALHVVVKCFKNRNLKFFQSAMQINRNTRLQIFQFLEAVEDSLLAAIARDPTTVNFMYNCLRAVQTNTMEWLSSTACTDNLQVLTLAENRTLSEEEEVEEIMINSALALLQRLYKIAFISSNIQSVHRFAAFVMDKVVTLAYMGHKRQRGPAIKVLYQAVGTDLGMHVKTKLPDAWLRYKNDLQGSYSTRMALLVKACELDWASQWSISIQLLGTDLHRGAMLINNLLSVEERAFKSTDTTVRRQAFVSWQLLVDNFALDMKELATTRRIKLLCVPLTAKNSKSELIALTKLEVWWYLITKLYPSILKFADPVITQFLNFCFGPLGDTPLLSTKVDVIASPGKRFYKTRIVAVDALLQLIVQKQEDRKAFPSSLEERLPHPIAEELFKDCYKAFLHSVGEAIIIIGQLHETEVTNREEVIKILLTNLMRYVRSTNAESKTAVYNELILVMTELLNRSVVSCVLDFVRDDVIPELSTVAIDFVYSDRTLMDLLSKIIVPSVLTSVQKKHCDAIACLMRQAVKLKAQTQFHPETLKFLGMTLQQLEAVPTDSDGFKDCFELWFAYAEIAYKYMMGCQDINEGTAAVPSFKTIASIVRFPFTHMYSANSIEAQRIAVHWKDLYKQFESQADVMPAVKPNEILDDTAKAIEECLMKNEKCYRLAAYCLEALLSTINYKSLLAQNQIPSIVRLVADVTAISLHESRHVEAEFALKALSSLLITVYGHSPDKALSYMNDTRQTIELMLKTNAEDNLVKEITSTWETIVSILRGLNTMLDANFLLSYKDTILLAMRHANSEISSQALSVLEMKDNVKEGARAILVEFAQEAKRLSAKKDIKIKSDKIISSLKHVKIAGSFLNRKIQSPRPTVIGKPKDKEEKKLAPPPPEPDSQDYVLITSDVKLDVSRLTEHQKESLKRRRDDIPAMYNDLSQSSSQNSQDLQQWFDGKVKRTGVNDLPDANKLNEVVVAVNENPKEENKIVEMICDIREEKVIEETVIGKNITVPKISEENSPTVISTPETIGSSGQDPASVFETIAEPIEPAELETSPPNESKDVQTEDPASCPVSNPLSDHSYVGSPKFREVSPDKEEPSEPVAKKLNFESREEYPEEKEKDPDENSSSDITPSGKLNRTRRSSKNNISSVEYESIVQRIKRTGLRKNGRSSGTGPELKSSNTPESQDITGSGSARGRGPGRPKGSRTQSVVTVPARGTKRKAASDSESEGSERDKRRRKHSRSPSITPSDSESVPTHTDKRTEIEMSRLRIDMVFDGPLPSRRRSKVNDEFVSSESLGKRQHSPDMTVTRTKSGENRIANLRRSFRGQEKEGPSNSDAAKKRRRKGNKLDAESKGESQRDEDEGQTTSAKNSSRAKSKRSLQESGVSSESQIIVDDEETADDSVAANTELGESLDVGNKDGVADSVSIGRVPTSDIAEHRVSDAVEAPAESDLDDIVESSQDSTAVTNNRKSTAKFGKQSNTVEVDRQMVIMDCSVDMAHPRASSPIIPSEDLPEADGAVKNKLLDDKTAHDDSDETFLDISAIRPQLGEDVPTDDTEQQKAPEESKTIASATSTKPSEPSFNLSSPKNPSKRYPKPKSFAPQGRAAHMLGLVTKLAVLEKDGQAEKSQTDEELAIRRNKSRDTENDTPLSKRDRSGIIRDSERMGSPGGSRQEKIFNNMKAVADYAASPPGKLFGNLRNDGEKVSPKMDKPAFDGTNPNADASAGNDHDGSASSTNERDELPILEWSSANPPSLTASPSASILKRNRPALLEMDSDATTPNKGQRKRVSFADPPVSKEMGYEIATGTSPLKPSKSTGFRGLLGRKDSPMRIKQSRFRMIQLDMEKTDEECEPAAPSSNEMDTECDRENELLMKIAEDLEQTVESRTPDDNESFSANNIPTKIDMSSGEITIGPKAGADENVKSKDVGEGAKKSDSILEPVTIESQTQDDLFNSSDEREEPKRSENHSIDSTTEQFNTSSQNSTMESFKLNVTNDSVIGSITNSSREDGGRSECLEDTVDARNLTSLNMTENVDDILGERPVRNGNDGGTSIARMDTLPVTDSLLTQDSQGSTQPNVQLAQPELLNSTDSVYPSLIDCCEPIETIIDSLTNPLWIKNLSKYFATRSLRTIGDLARLSEREVVRIPVKGSSKVDFVKRVLGRFEEKLRASGPKESIKMKDGKAANYLTLSPDKDVTLDIAEVMDIDDTRDDTQNVRDDTQKLPGDFSTLDATVPVSQIEPTQNDSMCIEDLDPLARQAITRTSTSNSISGIIIDPSSCSVLADADASSQISTILLSSDTQPTAKVSVATSTDSLNKPLTKSVGSQTTLEELLDDVDVNVLLQSAVKRSSAETLLEQFKLKMGNISESELGTETIRMLLTDGKTSYDEATLKAACSSYGLTKLLVRLPEMFPTDKQFYAKVHSAYCKRFKARDCIESLNIEDVKNEVCKKCSSAEISEMLSRVLHNEEERQDVKPTVTELSNLAAILKRFPMDLIISHTVENEELIPSSVVLDVALRNNDARVVTETIESKYPSISDNIFEKKMTHEGVVSHIEDHSMTRDNLLSLHRAVCDKLSPEDLLDAYRDAMNRKLKESSKKR